MNGISGEAPKGGGGAGFVAVMEKIGISGASSFLRRIMPRFFYQAPWDLPRPYRFARRCGGISRRSRSET